MKTTTSSLLLLGAALLLSSCGSKDKEAAQLGQRTLGAPLKYSKLNLNANPLNKTVCDPFNSIPADNLQQGIRASLHYRTEGMPIFNTSEDFVTFAKKSDQKLFFADLNVPTRKFEEGFSTQSNDVLKDDKGYRLIEHFGLKFDTLLTLGAEDEETDYELAILSDDGATLKVLTSTEGVPGSQVLISNEGEHETRMGCSTQTISMTKDTTLPIQLTYYQGPRYFISNVLLWRKASEAGKDPLCGVKGNDLYFDPNKGSAPKKAFLDLQARGWKVLGTENFHIPKDDYNPCVVGTDPKITNLKVLEVLMEGVFLNWETDIPATSQVKIVDKETGEVILTDTDNGLRVIHNLQVFGLQSGRTYTAQAVSISEDLGKTLSDIIEFTTP